MAKGSRNPAARRHRLYRELALRGAASVDELCALLAASPATIRRDLTELEREGLIRRSYGGAAVRLKRPAERAFEVREQEDIAAKRAIAKAALELISPGDTLFLNDGSTTLALAREIALADLALFVATPAINVASVLAENESITVCLLGGTVQGRALATSGPFAEAMTERINADLALLSCDGFGLDQGLSFMDPADAAIARRMVQKSKRSAALVVGRKFARSERVTAVPIQQLTFLVTDEVEPRLKGRLVQSGVEVIEAGKPTKAGAGESAQPPKARKAGAPG